MQFYFGLLLTIHSVTVQAAVTSCCTDNKCTKVTCESGTEHCVWAVLKESKFPVTKLEIQGCDTEGLCSKETTDDVYSMDLDTSSFSAAVSCCATDDCNDPTGDTPKMTKP